MKKAHDENLNEEWSKNNSVLWKKFKHKRNNQSAHLQIEQRKTNPF